MNGASEPSLSAAAIRAHAGGLLSAGERNKEVALAKRRNIALHKDTVLEDCSATSGKTSKSSPIPVHTASSGSNAVACEEEWIFLCEENMDKMILIINEGRGRTDRVTNKQEFLRDYYKGLQNILKSAKGFKRECDWLKQVSLLYG